MSIFTLARLTRLLVLLGSVLIAAKTFSACFAIFSSRSSGFDTSASDNTTVYLRVPHKHEMTLNRLDSVIPSATNITKAIIAPMMPSDDLSWIPSFFPDWRAYIYAVTSNDEHTLAVETPTVPNVGGLGTLPVAKNKGREASVYLTFLIDNWETLPDYMVFVHGKRYQWHTDDPMYDSVPPIANLRLEHIAKVGYASLRCTWQPGCPYFLEPDLNANDGFFGIVAAYAQAFAELFPGEELPDRVGAGCCAQFAVSKEKVRERPLADYVRYRKWLWETNLLSEKSGYILEYMWHIIFGKDAVHCPDVQSCFCDMFGYCDLQCSTFHGACKGRYKQPAWGASFPANWPEEGQGVNGWPKEGWWLDELKKTRTSTQRDS